jgi:excinuclease ABC subunit C
MNTNITQESKSRTNIGARIKTLPRTPGVYLYRDSVGKVIYVGKAVNLKNRVSSYFNGQDKDPKTEELVKKISKLDTIGTGSEFEALILESDLVKRYKPHYNIRLKDDKGYVYLKITKEEFPRISVARQIIDTEAEYLGPFIDSLAVKNILKLARKIFPYCSCNKRGDQVCLYFHLNLCPGHSRDTVSPSVYRKNISGIKKLFSGKTAQLEKEFRKGMRTTAKQEKYEEAAGYRDKLKYLERIKKSHFISERDLSADTALVQLKRELNLPRLPERIECFDISNIMGTAAVGSMAVFQKGIAAPKEYRRFQIRTVKGANDYAMLAEILSRRFAASEIRKEKKEKSLASNQKTFNSFRYSPNSNLPDLVILDGGKGQLSAVLQNVQIPDGVKVVALAKRKEQIFSLANNKSQMTSKPSTRLGPSGKQIPNSKLGNSDLNRNSEFIIHNLPPGSEAFFLVQRVRDEAHRFAVTYHRKVKSREMYETSLDAIPGIGPKTKKKLLAKFGSIQNIKKANPKELAKIVGTALSLRIREKL